MEKEKADVSPQEKMPFKNVGFTEQMKKPMRSVAMFVKKDTFQTMKEPVVNS